MDSSADIETLRAALAAERDRTARIEAELALARAKAADDAATIEECQAHLARAVRYASLASLNHQRPPELNVFEIRPGVRR